MNSEGKLPEKILNLTPIHREFRASGGGFDPLAHSTKTKSQRFLSVVVTQFLQQTSNRGGASTGASNQAECFGRCLLRFAHLLEQEAFKLLAIGRSIRIDPAMATGSQRAARLRKLGAVRRGRRAGWLCVLNMTATNRSDCQTEGFQAGGIVARSQFDGAEEGAVAAQAALQAEFIGQMGRGGHSCAVDAEGRFYGTFCQRRNDEIQLGSRKQPPDWRDWDWPHSSKNPSPSRPSARSCVPWSRIEAGGRL